MPSLTNKEGASTDLILHQVMWRSLATCQCPVLSWRMAIRERSRSSSSVTSAFPSILSSLSSLSTTPPWQEYTQTTVMQRVTCSQAVYRMRKSLGLTSQPLIYSSEIGSRQTLIPRHFGPASCVKRLEMLQSSFNWQACICLLT